MQLILSKQCESLTGSLGSGYGYAVQKQKGGYYAKRNSKGIVPPDGHLRFILKCAELAQMKLHIVDIKVNWLELQTALYEAKCFTASEQVRRNYADKGKATYNATDVFNFKQRYNL